MKKSKGLWKLIAMVLIVSIGLSFAVTSVGATDDSEAGDTEPGTVDDRFTLDPSRDVTPLNQTDVPANGQTP